MASRPRKRTSKRTPRQVAAVAAAASNSGNRTRTRARATRARVQSSLRQVTSADSDDDPIRTSPEPAVASGAVVEPDDDIEMPLSPGYTPTEIIEEDPGLMAEIAGEHRDTSLSLQSAD